MPIPTEYFKFWTVDELTSKSRRTTYRMTLPEAAERYPGAKPDLQTREVRFLPAPGETRANTKPPVEKSAVAEPKLRSCAFCEGSGWVCADHPALPFEHDDCGSEGSTCVCNPEAVMQWQHVYAEVPTDKLRH